MKTKTGKSAIAITFPGYKAEIQNNRVIAYDFKVNVVKPALHIDTAPSHVNIIIDLYCKVSKEPSLYNDFRTLLYNLSLDNNADPFANTTGLEGHAYSHSINGSLLDKAERIHRSLNKNYNREGNAWNYSLSDLVHCIKWIVLQEDINYPISCGKMGRKMPFARYYEAIYTAVHHHHNVEEVIRRTLQHYRRPVNWDSLDYSLLNHIQ